MKHPRSRSRRTLAVVLLACIILEVASFVVQPHTTIVRSRTQVPSTLQPYDPQQQEQEPSSILGKAANKITSWLPFKLEPKDELTRKGEQRRRRQQKELSHGMKEALRPFPWPVRAIGNSLTNTMTRTFGKEARKAEVLLADASHLIEADPDASDALGQPIITGRLLSQSSSDVMFNFIKSKRIKASFEVIGSNSLGVATMIADKYAKGHIVALRVHVKGIAYDIV